MVITDLLYLIAMLLGVVAIVAAVRDLRKNAGDDYVQVLAISMIIMVSAVLTITTMEYFGEDGREAYVREHISMRS